MSTKLFFPAWLACAALFFLLLAGVNARAAAVSADLSLEADLVLGSNDAQAGGTPVSPQIAKKLKGLPLKWSHYTIVSTQQFSVAQGAAKDVSLSDACQISVKNLGGERVELTLMGNGKNVGKITQSLKKGQTLVTGGSAGNTIVVLRQSD